MARLVSLICLIALARGATIPQTDDNLQGFIVGGKDTNISKVPYTIALLHSGRFICGGSIVSPTVIVTAAHCVQRKNPETISVRAGSSDANSGGVVVNASDIYRHVKYLAPDYDVAVVILQKPLKYSNTIQPIPLATREPRRNSIVKTVGYGHLTEDGVSAKTLQSVLVPVVDRTICIRNYEFYAPVTSRMICAGVEGKDSCQGDSGGPLVHSRKLVGVVSFGIGCGRKNLPGIYANVVYPEIASFIQNFIENN